MSNQKHNTLNYVQRTALLDWCRKAVESGKKLEGQAYAEIAKTATADLGFTVTGCNIKKLNAALKLWIPVHRPIFPVIPQKDSDELLRECHALLMDTYALLKLLTRHAGMPDCKETHASMRREFTPGTFFGGDEK